MINKLCTYRPGRMEIDCSQFEEEKLPNVLYGTHLKAYSTVSHQPSRDVDPHLHVDMLVPFLDKLVLLGIILHTLPLE
jgi:hypothetical protein